MVWRTVHVNHAKPAKTPADGFPAPLPPPEPPRPTLGCLPRSLQRPLLRRPLSPLGPAAPTAGSPHPVAALPAATPPSSRPTTRSAANRNSAPRAVQQPPTAPGRTNENSRLGQPLRRSAHLTPRACAVKKPPTASRPSAAEIWTVPWPQGRSIFILQPRPRRPPQWSQRIPGRHSETCRCSAQVT